MNWGRAKTILIIMFILVDIFLFFVLIQTRKDAVEIPDETLQATVQILQGKGIDIQKELIPKFRLVNQNIMMRNYFEEPTKTAELILKEFETNLADEQKRHYIFEGEKALLIVKDTHFKYQAKGEAKPYEKDVKPAEKVVFNQLKKLGFKGNEMVIVNSKTENGLFTAQVVPVYKDLKIYGISMTVTADREKILQLEGNWFRAQDAESYETETLLDVTAVLAGLTYRQDGWPKQITGIENGFYASDAFLNSREIAAVPIYAVMDKNGKIKCFDARIGNEIGEKGTVE